MQVKDAQTEEVSRRFDTSKCKDKSKGLGGVRGTSEINGVKSIRIDKTNSPGENIFGQGTNSGGTLGKILKRLDVVEGAFLSYVRGHRERLQIRIDESRKQEDEFLGIVSDLKKEVHELVSNQKKEDLDI